MSEPAATVYDLDGTLVRLAVEWEQVRSEVGDLFAEAGVPVPDGGLWGMMDAAPAHGLGDAVEATIARHEEAGAAASERLPAADELARVDGPVGVCSLNAESACRLALETHGLLAAVDAIVGRDSVHGHKPDPAPLLAVVDRLGVPAGETLFVGDSARDRETAKRAGTRFSAVEDYVRRRA